jgi:hypothetical protein
VGARLAPAAAPRADHEVGTSLEDRPHHVHELGRVVAAVPVEEDEHLRPRGGGDAGEARVAVAAPRLAHHRRARLPGHVGRPVARAVVDDDHLVHERRDLADDRPDGLLLVQGGNDDGDAESAHRGASLAHAGDGPG